MHATKWIPASVMVAVLMALIWFRAPLGPAIIGALAAGGLLYLRARRSTAP